MHIGKIYIVLARTNNNTFWLKYFAMTIMQIQVKWKLIHYRLDQFQ